MRNVPECYGDNGECDRLPQWISELPGVVRVFPTKLYACPMHHRRAVEAKPSMTWRPCMSYDDAGNWRDADGDIIVCAFCDDGHPPTMRALRGGISQNIEACEKCARDPMRSSDLKWEPIKGREPPCAACDHDRDAHAENGMSDNAGRFGGPCDMPDCPCQVFE